MSLHSTVITIIIRVVCMSAIVLPALTQFSETALVGGERGLLRNLLTTALIWAKPPYAICPNMTRNRGNYARIREGGEGKDKL